MESSTSIVLGSQGDSNTEPAGTQATVMDATWPQVRYWGESFALRGYKSVSSSQSWLAILNPLGPFIKIQTPRHYPRSTESECQGIRFHNVCICNQTNKQTKHWLKPLGQHQSYNNIYIIEVLKGREREGIESLLKETMMEKIP